MKFCETPVCSTAVTSAESSEDTFFATLYQELHRIARRELAKRGVKGSLGATTLLHEAYLNISGREREFPDRYRFLAYASRVMRGLIIDHSRNRHAQKRGGLLEITSLATDVAQVVPDRAELTRISDAINELTEVDPGLALVVDLKFFCGFSFVEIAAMRDVSERTVQRDWEKARIYLYRALDRSSPTAC